LIDVIEGNRVYMPCLHVFNKIDKVSLQEMEILAEHLPHFLPISGFLNWNIDGLKAPFPPPLVLSGHAASLTPY